MRGEDTDYGGGYGIVLETPPHAWGRLYIFSFQFYSIRNTPTCVGKTLTYY